MAEMVRQRREDVVAELNAELRNLVGRSVLFQQAVAERLGLNVSDLNCLGLLAQLGPVPAGRLAEELGLTTGGTTFAVDRLEAAGFVRRERDPKDRRRVIVVPVSGVEKDTAPLFDSLGAAMAELCKNYTRDELSLIAGFIRKAAPMTQRETAKLRSHR
ncbi:MarR family transcriptional regulator [Kribbella sp. NPDC023855]|uniref:MarR family winged helix-turn-helix transcriptional regulator n=1 Tax=Kribbella sp. NPDC023855 TaxID=3154698 RepID=UPI00341138C7